MSDITLADIADMIKNLGKIEEKMDEKDREITWLRGELFTCKADKCEALNRIKELKQELGYAEEKLEGPEQ